MSSIRVVPLGAGQDVGRSCVLVSMGGKNVMFDCGMHMGYNDSRRFPDFSYIAKSGPLTHLIDAVIISHFHLDHCGALPFFSEMRGYDGPIYMTYPTKAIAPILLEDYRKITVERKGETNFFTSAMIKDCMRKVVTVDLHQTIRVDDELEITAYYAGHVLGAAMFRIRVGEQSLVYTGDYNMTPDRHLGAAWIDKCRPDVIITESTYATTIRDSKRCRERNFLQKVHSCIEKGGKILIPVFALGRAQELCILLETYWERNNIKVPIYFSTGLTEKANHYYKLFISWTNEKIKRTFTERNMFEFKHILPFDRSYVDNPGPQVLFATPGMLHAGLSLHVFKKWAPNPANMVIMPGYCVAGTVGAKVLAGAKSITVDSGATIPVRLQVQYLSFSAHADAKGIMQLIKQCEAKNVVLVHGEKQKMGFLSDKIKKELGVDCFFPANGQNIEIQTSSAIPIKVSSSTIKRGVGSNEGFSSSKRRAIRGGSAQHLEVQGVLLMRDGEVPKLVETNKAANELGLGSHSLRFSSKISLKKDDDLPDTMTLLGRLHELIQTKIPNASTQIKFTHSSLSLRSVTVSVTQVSEISISWEHQDDDLATSLMTSIENCTESLSKPNST